MAKGASGIGKGNEKTNKLVEKAIQNAVNGGIDVPYEEMLDISSNQYGLNTASLSSAEKNTLSSIIPGKTSDIENGNTVQVKLGNLDMDQLKDVARISAKIGTYASTFCMEDALKLISYWQNNGIPFGHGR